MRQIDHLTKFINLAIRQINKGVVDGFQLRHFLAGSFAPQRIIYLNERFNVFNQNIHCNIIDEF